MSRRRSRLLSAGFLAFLLAVAGIGYLIALSAQEAILESQSGVVSEYSTDPTEPGFRAFTEPTPTALVLHTAVRPGGGAELISITLMTAADAQAGGTVITIPAMFANPRSTNVSLRDLFRTEGLDAVTNELRGALNIGFDDVVVLDASAWTTLMTADLPLQLSIRGDLVEPDPDGAGTRVVLAAGAREYSLVEIAQIAAHKNPDEPNLQVALRHQQIWQSWISRTAGAEERPELFARSGFVELIGALANAEVAYRVLPMETVAADNAEETVYVPEEAPVRTLMSRIVPFPKSATIGDRPTVLLLDTSFGEVAQGPVVESVARAGGIVSILGNSEAGAERLTEVQVHDPSASAVANEIAQSLGLAQARSVPLDGATAAITVVIG